MSQRLDHNRNGKQHDSCRNNQKDRGLCSTPHALNLALTVGESALRLHKFEPTHLTHQWPAAAAPAPACGPRVREGFPGL